ncbi:MAG TPA: HAMP domain-containing sensor histidine kinase [Phototrophicaceae bacterium]|nr:HAMP domain-containing sensor histidine kinase [Phototrophicaceae bacterium]
MFAVPERQQTNAVENSLLLIIEPVQSLRTALQQWFEATYTLIFADTAPEALNLVRQQSVDLVFLDLTILEMSGFDVLRQLRGIGIPVILITALSDSSTLVQGLQLGANDYITKPLDADVVRARAATQLALKNAEDERKRTITQLKFTQEMQENFTRVVSHDLKGPLTNIRMAQFMLRDILRDNPEAHSILDNMDTTLNSMIEMLRMFLDAMDSQQLEPMLAPLALHDLIVQITDQYGLAAGHKRIKLVMRDCDLRVQADERLLRQVLTNLISNAVKFSPAGTQTTVWAEARDTMVRICVADQGPGVRPEERDLLFNMFSKLSARPTGGEASTGLGLWIVKELTRLQNGRVGFDQGESGGSVFWVELPAAVPAA